MIDVIYGTVSLNTIEPRLMVKLAKLGSIGFHMLMFTTNIFAAVQKPESPEIS